MELREEKVGYQGEGGAPRDLPPCYDLPCLRSHPIAFWSSPTPDQSVWTIVNSIRGIWIGSGELVNNMGRRSANVSIPNRTRPRP